MAYIYSLADTWADGATTFKGISLNVTDTASAAGSLLMDLQVGGSSKFKVDKAGNIVLNPNTLITTTDAYYPAISLTSGIGGVSLYAANTGFAPGSAIYLVVNSNYDGNFDGTRIFNGVGFATRLTRTTLNAPDTIILRDAANTLAQRNGVNAQAFNLYNTYTDASNYSRASMYFSGGAFYIDNDLNAGTGITNASFWIKSRGTVYLSPGAGGYDVVTNNNGAGSLYPGGPTNTTNLGRSDKAFALGYFGTAAIIGGYVQVTEMTAPAAPATNNVRIYAEDDGAGKTRLMARFATGAAQQIAIEP